ncbi:MAG TPA: VOC family protein [Candidatus Eremiobacteraceae bacterium]
MTAHRASVVANPPDGSPRIRPHLIYDDPRAAIEWLTRVFGFRERGAARQTSPEGVIGRTQMEVVDSLITLGLPSVHGGSPGQDVSTMLYVYVDEVDVHYRRTCAAGADIVLELEDQAWGDRCYQVADLEGHQWTFAQRVEDFAADSRSGD